MHGTRVSNVIREGSHNLVKSAHQNCMSCGLLHRISRQFLAKGKKGLNCLKVNT